MDKIKLKWEDAADHLREADVVLCRNKNSLTSRILSRSGEGKYSHVGLVTRNGGNGRLEIVEFKEWKGGRVVDLERYVEMYPGEIDIYRSDSSYITKWFSTNSNSVLTKGRILDPRAVTNCMRALTGLPYGWQRIWWIAKHKMFLFRLFYNIDDVVRDMPGDEIIYPVCSTSVAHCFNKAGFDLVKHRSDEATEPNDIARSPVLSYLFTLEK